MVSVLFNCCLFINGFMVVSSKWFTVIAGCRRLHHIVNLNPVNGMVYSIQHYVIGQWFYSVSSTNKTYHHDITEILLKVALNTIHQPNHIHKIGARWKVIYITYWAKEKWPASKYPKYWTRWYTYRWTDMGKTICCGLPPQSIHFWVHFHVFFSILNVTNRLK